MSWLTYYFAADLAGWTRCLDDGINCNALISLVYLKNHKRQDEIHAKIRELRKRGHKFMLDSGGFTNFQKPGTIEMSYYLEYISQHADVWDEVIMLDDPASRQGTIKNFHHIRKQGFKPLFVDHVRLSTVPGLRKIWEGEDKLCLSAWAAVAGPGGGGVTRDENVAIQTGKRADLAREVKTRVHLLSISSLAKFLPHLDIISSVDSASWQRGPGFGVILAYTTKEIGGMTVPAVKVVPSPLNLTGKDTPPEILKTYRAFKNSRKWETKRERVVTEFFCMDQIKKYVAHLNRLNPSDLMLAFKKHKDGLTAAKKSFVFFDDLPEDVWFEPLDAAKTVAWVEQELAAETVDKAERLLAAEEHGEEINKRGVWGSPAGKSFLLKQILPRIPKHKTYVEPFAGGAAVFFGKERAEKEVLNDSDREIAGAFSFVRDHTETDVAALKKLDWSTSKEHFDKLLKSNPHTGRGKFHRFVLLRFLSVFRDHKSGNFDPDQRRGDTFNVFPRLEKARERLQGVEVFTEDYEQTIKRFDKEDTFFFLDPPYKGTDQNVGEKDFDHDRFVKVLRSIKGQFLLTLDSADGFDGFGVTKVKHQSGTGSGMKEASTFFISNYGVKKRLWGSAGGKHFVAKKLASMLPTHKTYVEPFAGGASVFYVKGKAGVEVLGDADPDVVSSFTFVRDCTDKQIEKVKTFNWTCTRDNWERAVKLDPKTPEERFYKFAFLRWSSFFSSQKKSINPLRMGQTCSYPNRLEKARERLAGVKLFEGDYKTLCKRFDGPDTVFFLDPPFPEIRQTVFREKEFDTGQFVDFLKTLKGKFIVTYTGGHAALFKGFSTSKMEFSNPIQGKKTELTIVTNFAVKKAEETIKQADYPTAENSTQPGVAQLHFRGDTAHLDLRFGLDAKTAIGWTIAAQIAGKVKDVETVKDGKKFANSFRAEGSDWNKPFVAPAKLFATPKDKHPIAWLKLKDQVIKPGDPGARGYEPGVFVNVERFNVDYGLQKPDFHEYFVKGSKHFDGIIYLRKVEGPERTAWTFWRSKELTPSVLTPRQVKKGFMPPDGVSALPRSLMEQTPAEFRYWTKTGAEARKMRDALVESGFFAPSKLGLVDGKIRRVVTKMVIDPHPEVEEQEVEKTVALLPVEKADEEKRIVFGVVLQPGVKDSQGDVISAEEIETAAHRWLAKFQDRGLMHKKIVNGKIEIYESYLSPVDFAIGGEKVLKGTWLMMYHIVDGDLWNDIKTGKLTGFSIGGFARRVSS